MHAALSGCERRPPAASIGATRGGVGAKTGSRTSRVRERGGRERGRACPQVRAPLRELRGLVLDIGCGIAARPAYFTDDPDCTYVGIDPLDGAVVREFDFVQGIAERLPFADATFDGVISATMLDHVPDPTRVLSDARRVLKPAWQACSLGRRRRRPGAQGDGVPSASASRPRADPGVCSTIRSAWHALAGRSPPGGQQGARL